MKRKFWYISAILAAALGLGIFAGIAVLSKDAQEVAFPAFLHQVESGQIEAAVIVRQDVYGYVHGNSTRYHTTIPSDSSTMLWNLLTTKGIRTTWTDLPPRNRLDVLLQASPFIAMALFRVGVAVAICLVIVLCARRFART